MRRRDHDSRDSKKVWLSTDEVNTLLDHVDDPLTWIGVALGVRCGLRSAETVAVTPSDLVDGPTGRMVRVRDGKGGDYRETPAPGEVATRIETVAELQNHDNDDPIVDVTTRTLRRRVGKLGDQLADETGDDGWRDLSTHDLRRTWATNLSQAGVDPLVALDWGGWNDLETFLDHYQGAFSPEAQRRERDAVGWL